MVKETEAERIKELPRSSWTGDPSTAPRLRTPVSACRWWHTLLMPALRRQRQVNLLSSRPAWSTEGVPGQAPKLHRETNENKNKNHFLIVPCPPRNLHVFLKSWGTRGKTVEPDKRSVGWLCAHHPAARTAAREPECGWRVG